MTTTITGATGVNQITDDAITAAKLPAGCVLQVVQSNTILKSGTWTDSTNHLVCSISITPKSSTSKMFIVGQIVPQLYGNDNTPNLHFSFRVYKDSSSIIEAVSMHHNTINGSNTFHKTPTYILSGVDLSGNTNARSYHLYLQKTQASNHGRLQLHPTHGSTNIRVVEVEV